MAHERSRIVNKDSQTNVVPLPKKRSKSQTPRKANLNKNKNGSVRKINGEVYVDFRYLGQRVRESSGLPWNATNAKAVRGQLDRIAVAIDSGTFRFAEVFPESKKRDYIQKLEVASSGRKMVPEEIHFREEAQEWYELLRQSQRVTGRTLNGYKSYLDNYLMPFFGEKPFSELNAATFAEFVSWARKLKLRKKAIGNTTINKFFKPLRMICTHTAIKHGWSSMFNPFFGFKKLPENDPSEDIAPFSLREQQQLRRMLPAHWQPYFDFAFRSGLRPGEQIGLRLDDIDWENRVLHVKRAITLDEYGKKVEGRTKNKYSRRSIKLTEAMLQPLRRQKAISEAFKSAYLFCTENGYAVDLSNLQKKVWTPALNKAHVPVREMRQTRHSFATNALIHGENPLWIAKVMGHRNTNMIINVYMKLIENTKETTDGLALAKAYENVQFDWDNS